MRKRNGWCIWSPWSGYLSSTFAGTRTECIKVFELDSNSPWRRYREQGFECRPVLFVDARKESGDARWCERMRKFAALAALQREQWIPVSERLPPEGVDVLVLCDYGQIVGNPAHRDYGTAPHACFYQIGASVGGSRELPESEWPANFALDPDSGPATGYPRNGIWTHCLRCGDGSKPAQD